MAAVQIGAVHRQGIDKKRRPFLGCSRCSSPPQVGRPGGDRSLGILEVKDRPARVGRNPAPGEAAQVKASKQIVFRVAKGLKDAL